MTICSWIIRDTLVLKLSIGAAVGVAVDEAVGADISDAVDDSFGRKETRRREGGGQRGH